MRRLLLAVLVAGAVWHFWPLGAPPVEHAPPPAALMPPALAQAPVQRDLAAGAPFRIAGTSAQPLAEYAVTGRVLGTRRYRLGHAARLAPLDVALGWGGMADPAVVSRLEIAQRHRWYLWRYAGAAPLPVREIETSSANLHLIPANAAVARALRRLRAGQTVTLSGYLVALRRTDGWQWRSSLTRTDTGAGSCELMYVQSAVRGP